MGLKNAGTSSRVGLFMYWGSVWYSSHLYMQWSFIIKFIDIFINLFIGAGFLKLVRYIFNDFITFTTNRLRYFTGRIWVMRYQTTVIAMTSLIPNNIKKWSVSKKLYINYTSAVNILLPLQHSIRLAEL